MKKFKMQNGITLVALIITIVVLLILAGVAIGAVKNSDIIGYAKQAGTSYKDGKTIEESRIKEYEKLLADAYGKSARMYRYITSSGSPTDMYIILTSDNKMFLNSGNDIIQGTYEYDEGWTVINSNISIGEIILAYVDGDLMQAFGLTKDGNKIFIAQDGDLEAKTIEFNESEYLEIYPEGDVTAYLVENKWTERGLLLAKTDKLYTGTLTALGADSSATLLMKQDGGVELILKIKSETGEIVEALEVKLTNERVEEYIKSGDIQIESGTTLFFDELDEIEDTKILFTKNGNMACLVTTSGEVWGTLYFEGQQSETIKIDSYLYFQLEKTDMQLSDNDAALFVDTDGSISLWMTGNNNAYGDMPFEVGYATIIPANITKKDGSEEFRERAIYATIQILGTSKSMYVGYLTENNEFCALESDRIITSKKLLSESMNFDYIYDTEEKDSLSQQNISYGFISDSDSTTTGTYYIIMRYKEKYDCVINIPAKYKIEEGMIQIEERNSSYEPKETYKALPESAKLRQ